MSGQLGELVIELAANTARLQSDMGKAARATQEAAQQMTGHMSGAMAQIEGMFSGLGKVAGGAMAILAGGTMFKDMIGTTKEVAGEVVKLSKSLGITAEEASVLRIALDDAFITVDAFTGASSKLVKMLVKNEEAVKDLGVSTRDGNGHFRDQLTIMTEVNSRLMEYKEGTDRNIEGMKIYGKGWDEARATLKLTSEAMVEGRKRAQELHLIMGDDAIKSIKEYKLAMKDLDDVHESFKVSIGLNVIKPLTSLAVVVGDVGLSITQHLGVSMDAASNVIEVMVAQNKMRLAKFKLWVDETFGSPDAASYSQIQARKLAIAAQEGMIESGGPKFGSEDHLMNMGRLANPKKVKGERSEGSPDEKAASILAQYTSEWNKLQDEIRQMNPLMDEHDKELAKVNDKYDTLIGKYPQSTTELEHNRTVMLSWVQAKKDHDELAKTHEQLAKEIAASSERENKLLEDKRVTFEKVATTQERYDLEMQKLNQHLIDGTMDNETWMRSIASLDNQFNKTYSDMAAQLLELSGNYLEAAKARQAFEESSPAFQGMTPEQQELKRSLWSKQNKGLVNASSGLSGFESALDGYTKSAENWGENVKGITENAFKGMEDAMTQFAQTGKLNFKDMTNAIIADMVRMQAKMVISGLVNMIGSYAGSLFGGVSQGASPGADGVSLSSAGYNWSGPSFATGTDYVPYDMIAQIHKGEKIVPAAENKTGGAAGSMAVTVQIENKSSQDVKGSQGETKFNGREYVIGIILNDVQQNGPLRGLMAGAS